MSNGIGIFAAGFCLHFSFLSFTLLIVHENESIYDLHFKRIEIIYVRKRKVSVLLQKKAGSIERNESRFSVFSYPFRSIDEVKKSITLTAWNERLFPQVGHTTS